MGEKQTANQEDGLKEAEVIQFSDFHASDFRSCDQLAGLNKRAEELIHNLLFVCEERTIRRYPDGRVEISDPIAVFEPEAKKEESGEHYPGARGNMYALFKYTLPDGEVYYETLQSSSTSGSQVFFLALRHADGRMVLESQWTAEEMASY